MKPIFERAVIAGVGLIGGSLAIAGKKAGVFGTVVGLGRTEATLNRALALGIADEISSDIAQALKGADFFFISTPVESIIPLCIKAVPFMKDGCVVTDGGSVKGKIVRELTKALPSSVKFIGGHPVAGTEKSGPDSAFATLYENRYTILTPTATTDPTALNRVTKMWEAVGSKVITMSPDEHDEALAVISHLPHLAAYALVETLDKTDKSGEIKKFVAGGFKDITRIAASHPEMWRDIFEMNKAEVLRSVTNFEASMAGFKKDIENGDFDSLLKKLENAKNLRLAIENQ
ncbi:Cyclohexadienyl dehydrogenase [hydrothermal vent metagenome]|uniref:Cyclohexadienyl dehydrogenase n=1 Tax=hydrothermal vent metagenome TaxID=652676 RepID=A0A3B1D001_9ZZZZ